MATKLTLHGREARKGLDSLKVSVLVGRDDGEAVSLNSSAGDRSSLVPPFHCHRPRRQAPSKPTLAEGMALEGWRHPHACYRDACCLKNDNFSDQVEPASLRSLAYVQSLGTVIHWKCAANASCLPFAAVTISESPTYEAVLDVRTVVGIRIH